MADLDDAMGEVPEKNGFLSALFSSCSPDPRGSVHRAWGISLLFVVLYFIMSIFERKCKQFEVVGICSMCTVRRSSLAQWTVDDHD